MLYFRQLATYWVSLAERIVLQYNTIFLSFKRLG